MTAIAETNHLASPVDLATTERPSIEEGVWDLERHFGYSGVDDPKIGLDIQEVQRDIEEWISPHHDDLPKPLYESLTDRLLAYEKITIRLGLLRAYMSLKTSENVHLGDVVAPHQNQVTESITKVDNFMQQTIAAGMQDSTWTMVSDTLYRDGWRLDMLFRPLRNLSDAECVRMANIQATILMNAHLCHRMISEIRIDLPDTGILNRHEANNRIFLLKNQRDREDARRQLSERERALGPTLCDVLLESVSCQDEQARLYGLPDAKAMGLYAHNIPETAYDSLVSVARGHAKDYWRRYNDSLSKLLDIPVNSLQYDDDPDRMISERGQSFADLVGQIARAWGAIDTEFSSIMQTYIKENRILWKITNDRSSRQYHCVPAPGVGSFIAVRFDGSEPSRRTLTHELGHMFHLYVINSAKRRFGQGFEKSIVVGEVCSLFSESLCQRSVIDTVDDPKEKAARILSECQRWFSQIFLNINVTEFEKDLHGYQPKQGVDAFDDLSRMRRQHSHHWAKPVFNTTTFKSNWFLNYFLYEKPFCILPYTISQMIVLSLIEMYEEAQDAGTVHEFSHKLKSFMAAGGTKDPQELLRDSFGIELGPELYEKGFKLIDKRLKEASLLLDAAEKSESS